jgi:hypothetical protein
MGSRQAGGGHICSRLVKAVLTQFGLNVESQFTKSPILPEFTENNSNVSSCVRAKKVPMFHRLFIIPFSVSSPRDKSQSSDPHHSIPNDRHKIFNSMDFPRLIPHLKSSYPECEDL